MRRLITGLMCAATLLGQGYPAGYPLGAAGAGLAGPQGSLGSTTITSATTHTMDSPASDLYNYWVFKGTVAPTYTLVAPASANYQTAVCNATNQDGTFAVAGHAYQTGATGGTSTTNFTMLHSTTLEVCYVFTTDGTTWNVHTTQGPTGATGATGSTGANGPNTSAVAQGCNGSTLTNTTNYFSPGSCAFRANEAASTTAAQGVFNRATTISQLLILTTGAQPGTGSLTFIARHSTTPGSTTMADCGTPGTLTVVIAASSPTGTFADNTNSCVLAAGDYFDWKIVATGASASASLGSLYATVTQ